MISLRYLKFVGYALLASSILAVLMSLQETDVSILPVALASIFAILFVSLVVIRLPVFRNFYKRKTDISVIDTDNRHRDGSEYRAALVMSGSLTGGLIALALFPIGLANIHIPALCGAVCASVMSLYYEP